MHEIYLCKHGLISFAIHGDDDMPFPDMLLDASERCDCKVCYHLGKVGDKLIVEGVMVRILDITTTQYGDSYLRMTIVLDDNDTQVETSPHALMDIGFYHIGA
jgi:7-keto-8-aminopelargonate synthetase-like enzyme